MDMTKIPQPESSVKRLIDLSGKNVLITGGAGFLGAYFCDAIAEMGGMPLVVDLREQEVTEAVRRLSAAGYHCDGAQLDLTNTESVSSVVESLVAKHGHIDVLVNAAAFAMKNLKEGGANFFAPFEDYERRLWQVSIDVNLTGTFLVTQAVGRHMRSRGRGVVVNIASDVGIISPDHRIYEPDPHYNYEGVAFNTPFSYSVSKAGILAFTRYLATYWAQYGIRVNALSPAGAYRNHDPKFVEQLALRIPLGRMAFPQEYKAPLVFLASDASSFMTGANLIVDGGRTAW